ncbi:MAG: hypothetical protein KDD56_03600, partial [Bdellovibrionales bacterium]|nr:hypothetical protein [Bdellovibrionales bacterium]
SDRILMLENACYSVITPEGCASILWGRDRENAPANEQVQMAADALQLTASSLLSLGVIDEIVPEPNGGAHRNHKEAAEILGTSLVRNLEELGRLSVQELLDQRYKKFRGLGPITGDN